MVSHTVCTELTLITASHLCLKGTVSIGMYSTLKDIKIIMIMLIILYYIHIFHSGFIF